MLGFALVINFVSSPQNYCKVKPQWALPLGPPRNRALGTVAFSARFRPPRRGNPRVAVRAARPALELARPRASCDERSAAPAGTAAAAKRRKLYLLRGCRVVCCDLHAAPTAAVVVTKLRRVFFDLERAF